MGLESLNLGKFTCVISLVISVLFYLCSFPGTPIGLMLDLLNLSSMIFTISLFSNSFFFWSVFLEISLTLPSNSTELAYYIKPKVMKA